MMWGERRHVGRWLLVGACVIAAACGGSGEKHGVAEPACARGESRDCTCPGIDAPGAQVCSEDGSGWEACDCGEQGAAGETGAGGAGALGGRTTDNTGGSAGRAGGDGDSGGSVGSGGNETGAGGTAGDGASGSTGLGGTAGTAGGAGGSAGSGEPATGTGGTAGEGVSGSAGTDASGGAGGEGGAVQACSPANPTECALGLVCELVVGGGSDCFAPIALTGQVRDSISGASIEGATVLALDSEGVAVSTFTLTGADGGYRLDVRVPRNADGSPADDTFHTLRADASGYQTFPTVPRTGEPIDMSGASGSPLLVTSPATDVVLIPLSTSTGGTVSGTITGGSPGGALIVVGSMTGIADVDGNFTVFNVAVGATDVYAYQAGTQFSSVTVDVGSGELVDGVLLEAAGAATAVVSGTVQLINTMADAATSIILVVEDTFVANTASGHAPPGLRAANVTGPWSIGGVPDGTYVVLAAFENDGLVRDPDPSIAGTQIAQLSVSGGVVTPDPVAAIRVTDALDVIGPGAEGAEAVTTATPTFVFEDDSSEVGYTVTVHDAFGELVWETQGDFDPGGNADVEVAYAGPALEPGMYYQFRAFSYDAIAVPLSSTEDLKGVFWYDGG